MTGRRRALVLGLLLVDIPVLAACSVAGLRYGFADTMRAVIAWRLEHPLAALPSLALAAVLVIRGRRNRARGALEPTPEAIR